jgi:hypothetical protein
MAQLTRPFGVIESALGGWSTGSGVDGLLHTYGHFRPLWVYPAYQKVFTVAMFVLV